MALISIKMKKLTEKMMKIKKGKAFGAKRESKDNACFECGKKRHFEWDCYRMKNKPKPSKPKS